MFICLLYYSACAAKHAAKHFSFTINSCDKFAYVINIYLIHARDISIEKLG